ncbi:thiol protease/hemagglutinin PrtT [Bacteroides oleiciplenus]|uniref:T9SS C-terminal target domain-containing protein n=1 Tax=Bacteroides oleiciplenus TaxID=626931 RepID=A0A3E5B1J1_9BACE|nr:thiol protease/hemagglutinin PrtT [Bacteroides oleiciplenus]RGN31419.1 T9SS C-terminal target domain-containing protein [Bacteroides oleiciplenus]
MKKLLLLLLVLLCSLRAWTAQRSPEEALSIARTFFMQSSGVATRNVADVQLVAVSGDLLKSASTRGVEGIAFYVYNNAQSAYVIVSGDDRMKSVLGYSDNGGFVTENLPSNIQGWLENYNTAYMELVNGKQEMIEPQLLTRATFPKTVAPMMSGINWDQDTPYKNACPIVDTERSVTGCVATAMAMIMKYYEYPVKGKGAHSYKLKDGQTCSFNYGNTTFRWDKMLPQYVSGAYTAEEADAVAELMYACGVAVEMVYSPNGSGASSRAVAQALIDYFGYNENLGYVSREYFTSTEWMDMIKKELSEGRPVLYNGASIDVGHEFVFDGYDAQDMVHVNWGWGGANNGYFEVTSLNPSSPGIGGGTNLGGGFVFGQGMITGMQPSSESMTYVSRFYLSKLEASKLEVTKEEKFAITITKMFNMTSMLKNGQLALIAEKGGEQLSLGKTAIGDVKSNYGTNSMTLSDVTIPKSLADGTYALYMATKDERETRWSRVRGIVGNETQFTLVVTGEKCVLTPFSGSLKRDEIIGSVESLHNLYGGRRGDFRVLLTNQSTTTELYGQMAVVFITKDEAQNALALVGEDQVLLPPGTVDKELLLSGDLQTYSQALDLSAGDYYICPAIQWGDYWWFMTDAANTVTVNKATGSPTLVAKNIRLENNQLKEGETLKLSADLSLSGIGNVYDEKLMAAIFKVGENSTTNLHYAEVFVEEGKSLNFMMEIDPMVGEGKYTVNLYKPEANGQYNGDKPLAVLSFTVSSITGIEDEVVDKDVVVIYGQPVEDVLRVHTSVAASNISIYNVSGQKVLQQVLSDTTGNEYSVSVGRLTAGYYIVILQSVDGKIYRSKFIKK